MAYESDFLENAELVDGILRGEREVLGQALTLEYDPDEEGADFESLEGIYKGFEEYLVENFETYMKQIVSELEDAIYEQDEGYESQKAEHEDESIEKELLLLGVTVYPDAIMLIFEAKKSFPDYEIYVQVDVSDYSIEDISLN